MDDILKYREDIKNNILKSFQADLQKSEENDIEKARSGVYADNPENRRLNRVGKQYGHAGKEDEPNPQSKKSSEEHAKNPQSKKSLEEYAKNTSDEVLKKVIDNENAPGDLRNEARNELARRQGVFNTNPVRKTHKIGEEHPNGKHVWGKTKGGNQDWVLKEGGGKEVTMKDIANKLVSLYDDYTEGSDTSEKSLKGMIAILKSHPVEDLINPLMKSLSKKTSDGYHLSKTEREDTLMSMLEEAGIDYEVRKPASERVKNKAIEEYKEALKPYEIDDNYKRKYASWYDEKEFRDAVKEEIKRLENGGNYYGDIYDSVENIKRIMRKKK